MTRRLIALIPAAVILAITAAPAAVMTTQNPPRQLTDYSQILAALKAGASVRAVFHYKDMALTVDNKPEKSVPDAVGGMDVGAFEAFAPGSIGNKEGFVTFSHTQLIKHLRHGAVLNYVKVSVFETNKVRILVQYLAPTTYAVKMDETFDSEVNNGANKAGAYFYLIE